MDGALQEENRMIYTHYKRRNANKKKQEEAARKIAEANRHKARITLPYIPPPRENAEEITQEKEDNDT